MEYLRKAYASEFEETSFKNPLTDESFGILSTDELQNSKGTGISPMIPAHNFDDYALAIQNDLPSDVIS